LRAAYLFGKHQRPRPWDDPWIGQALRYLQALTRAPQYGGQHPVPADLAGIAEAYRLQESDSLPRWHLEARLLTAEPIEEVARRCALTQETVAAFHYLFFDVRSSLPSRDYILHRVIGCQGLAGFQLRDSKQLLQSYAYLGGPRVLDSLLRVLFPAAPPNATAGLRAPNDLAEVRRDLQCRAALLVRMLPLDQLSPSRVGALDALLETMERLGQEATGMGDHPLLPILNTSRPGESEKDTRSEAVLSQGAVEGLLAQRWPEQDVLLPAIREGAEPLGLVAPKNDAVA
jgi:hypothetical protein